MGIFNHVHKSLPALTSHWNQTHPESKAEVRRIFEEIRDLNQALQAKNLSPSNFAHTTKKADSQSIDRDPLYFYLKSPKPAGRTTLETSEIV